MKNKLAKIVLTMLLVALLMTILTGCPAKNDDPPRNVKAELKSQILASSNELWNTAMTDETIAGLSNAGDYYIAESWADFGVWMVDLSGFSDAKIESLIKFFASEKGIKMLNGQSFDIFALINEAGLTSRDAENLIYNTLYYYLLDGERIYDRAITNMEELSTNPNLSSETRQNLKECRDKMLTEETIYECCWLECMTARETLDDAESSIKTLISFAYNNSTYLKNNTSNGFFDGISSGMLQGATAGEIATYFRAMTKSIKDTCKALEGHTQLLGKALGELSSVYKKLIVLDNEILNDIFSVVENSKALPTLVPVLSEMACNFESIALAQSGGNHAFVEGLTTALGDGYATPGKNANANERIGYVRAGLALVGIDYTATGDTLSKQIAGAKTLVERMIDGMLTSDNYEGKRNAMNLSAMLYINSENGTMIGDISAFRVCEFMVIDACLASFQKYWVMSVVNMDLNINAVRTTAEALMKYATGEEFVDVGNAYNYDWFENIYNQVIAKMESEVKACYPTIKADIDSKIDALFAEGMDNLIALAQKTPVRTDDEGYDALDDEVYELYGAVRALLYPEK